MTLDLDNYFRNPVSPKQRQYELIRALTLDEVSIEEAAEKYNYKVTTVYSLLRDAKSGKIKLFPEVIKGPKKRTTLEEVQKKIISYRRKRLSSTDIEKALLKNEGIKISDRTIERILKEAGFPKLKRRTNKELGKTPQGKIIPERADHLDFTKLEPFNIDCPIVGVFFFIPYILESRILDVVKKCELPESSDINATAACLSILLFKLIGGKRLSHMSTYDQEPGLGLFAGLNVLPKSTYMSTYSCRLSEKKMTILQEELIRIFLEKYPYFMNSNFINLDFHSIPHYGSESQMEKVWCGARGKAMKGANTVFVQDAQSKALVYTRADILRSEEADEVKKFVKYWKNIKGTVQETLVFDCKFTTYQVLDELSDDQIEFITLRKRNANLVKKTLEIPKEDWQRVQLSIPKRKHKRVSVYEDEVKLKGCKNTFRQIIIKDHGRSNPTFILSNNEDLSLKKILEVYAKRWRVENKLGELVEFFNLNALSSPIMIRIHFDILWTLIADTLYHRFSQDLRRFEKALAPQIFKKFINMPGRVIYDGEKFIIKIRKRAHTPILKEVEMLKSGFPVPWLDNKKIDIVWSA